LGRVLDIIKSNDFNFSLINLLIDLYSMDYKRYFEELWFDEENIRHLNEDEKGKLTKLAAVIEYVGNRKTDIKLYNWIYSNELKLDYPYTPGVEEESVTRVKRILTAPKEFSLRNVFYDYTTIKPIWFGRQLGTYLNCLLFFISYKMIKTRRRFESLGEGAKLTEKLNKKEYLWIT